MAASLPLAIVLAGMLHAFLNFKALICFFALIFGWRLFIAADAAFQAKTSIGFKDGPLTKVLIGIAIAMLGLYPMGTQSRHLNPRLRGFRVNSDSMCPTICEGEHVISDMDAFLNTNPLRGEPIIFLREPQDALLIKRVIAIPGDNVEWRGDGTITVNGVAVGRPQVCGEPRQQKDESAEVPMAGKSTVPPGALFVIGDNLANSYDSRIEGFGFVTLSEVRGKPTFLYWSTGRNRTGCAIQ